MWYPDAFPPTYLCYPSPRRHTMPYRTKEKENACLLAVSLAVARAYESQRLNKVCTLQRYNTRRKRGQKGKGNSSLSHAELNLDSQGFFCFSSSDDDDTFSFSTIASLALSFAASAAFRFPSRYFDIFSLMYRHDLPIPDVRIPFRL